MREDEAYFTQDIYSEHLATFNGVNFTRRQIDVISCLTNMRGSKKIAELLSLYPRSVSPDTVRTYIQNIMQKLGCNSRENIIDFIEASHKLSTLRKYYTSLVIESTFGKALQEISKIKREENPTCIIVYWCDQNSKKTLMRHLKTHLSWAGLTAEVQEQPLDQNIEKTKDTNSFLLLLIEKKIKRKYLQNF